MLACFVWMEVWRLGLVHFGVGFGYKLKICLTAGGVEIVILIFARSDWACVNTWSRSIFPLSRFIIWRISLKLFIIAWTYCFRIQKSGCFKLTNSHARVALFDHGEHQGPQQQREGGSYCMVLLTSLEINVSQHRKVFRVRNELYENLQSQSWGSCSQSQSRRKIIRNHGNVKNIWPVSRSSKNWSISRSVKARRTRKALNLIII